MRSERSTATRNPQEATSGVSLAWPGTGAAPADPLIGASVGSFQIQRLLGRGALGSVYLAEHPVIGNKVAVKFLHDALTHDPDAVWRFYQEARAAHLVGHEHIVSIYDLNLLPPRRYYLVMEYLEGETLSQRLQRGPLPIGTALRVLIQLCDALHCAHEAGVVHRDLKPDNLFLVERRGQADFLKLVDFGVARLREGKGRPAGPEGAPEFLSPEQCEGRAGDARSDLYAVGVLAFLLVTGRLPFEASDPAELRRAHRNDPPPRPSALTPAIDARFEAAILAALAKAPADRPADARALGSALLALLEDLEHPRGSAPPRRLPELPAEADPDPRRDPLAEALLARYRPHSTHYQLLDLPWDVEFSDVTSRGGRLRADLEALRERALSPGQARELADTLQRVSAAVSTLSSMEQRIAYDGELGNFPGVMRALAAGIPALRLDEAHARFRAAHPELDERVDLHLARAQAARAQGDAAAAVREYEHALRVDPLNRTLHEAWQRQKTAGR